jgi:hypothetical protein
LESLLLNIIEPLAATAKPLLLTDLWSAACRRDPPLFDWDAGMTRMKSLKVAEFHSGWERFEPFRKAHIDFCKTIQQPYDKLPDASDAADALFANMRKHNKASTLIADIEAAVVSVTLVQCAGSKKLPKGLSRPEFMRRARAGLEDPQGSGLLVPLDLSKVFRYKMMHPDSCFQELQDSGSQQDAQPVAPAAKAADPAQPATVPAAVPALAAVPSPEGQAEAAETAQVPLAEAVPAGAAVPAPEAAETVQVDSLGILLEPALAALPLPVATGPAPLAAALETPHENCTATVLESVSTQLDPQLVLEQQSGTSKP